MSPHWMPQMTSLYQTPTVQGERRPAPPTASFSLRFLGPRQNSYSGRADFQEQRTSPAVFQQRGRPWVAIKKHLLEDDLM
ncbi:Hypothetical predicted protein, partial [Pelobates cultripes]